MGMAFIGFIRGILTLDSGLMGRAMALVCRAVRMEVPMLGSSSVGLNMALVFTTSGKNMD